MRFAVSRFSKAIVIGALGCAAAVLVACGDSNGLLSSDRASSLDRALDGVSAACSRGLVDDAQSAADKVRQEVDRLSAREVDRRLIRNLREGASTIQQLVPKTCDEVTDTVETQTEVQPSPQSTTGETPPPQTTPNTTPTTPDGGGTTTPDGGGTTTTPGNDGNGNGNGGNNGNGNGNGQNQGGGGTPDTGGGSNIPDHNQGNPGGALAPGQGGSTP